MSRITGRPTTATLTPWANTSGTSQYTGTATPPGANQAYEAIPDTGAQPSSGTGFYSPGMVTYVGQKFDTSDGRVLTLVQNGAVALAAGVAVQSAAETVAFYGLAVLTGAVGQYTVTLTNGSTVLNQNRFQGGYLVTKAGSTENSAGYTYKIASHSGGANAGVITVTLEDPIAVAFVAGTTTATLIASPYVGVIINPTTQTGTIAGATLGTIAASTAATYNSTSGVLTANGVAQYGLIATKGPTACLMDTVTNVGYPVGASTGVAGALQVATLTHSAQVGINMQTSVSGSYSMVYLQL